MRHSDESNGNQNTVPVPVNITNRNNSIASVTHQRIKKKLTTEEAGRDASGRSRRPGVRRTRGASLRSCCSSSASMSSY